YHKHLMSGGKPRQGVVPGARRLTVQESAVIQSFPRDIQFVGPRSAQYHQVGDAVPPRLAAIVAKSLVRQLHGVEERCATQPEPTLFPPVVCNRAATSEEAGRRRTPRRAHKS